MGKCILSDCKQIMLSKWFGCLNNSKHFIRCVTCFSFETRLGHKINEEGEVTDA